jgi:hypothetical protein
MSQQSAPEPNGMPELTVSEDGPMS